MKINIERGVICHGPMTPAKLTTEAAIGFFPVTLDWEIPNKTIIREDIFAVGGMSRLKKKTFRPMCRNPGSRK